MPKAVSLPEKNLDVVRSFEGKVSGQVSLTEQIAVLEELAGKLGESGFLLTIQVVQIGTDGYV